MKRRGVAEGPRVFRARLLGERIRGAGPAVEHVVQEHLRIRAKDALGQIVGLGQEEPQPVSQAERQVSAAERLSGRHDVEHGQLEHSLGMVERHAVRATATTVVPHDEEPVVAELAHHLDLVACHRSLRIGRVVGIGRRLAAVSVAAQVRGHDGKLLREARSELVPHDVRLGDAVQQQGWRAIAAVPHPDQRLAGVDHRLLEPLEHPAYSSCAPFSACSS